MCPPRTSIVAFAAERACRAPRERDVAGAPRFDGGAEETNVWMSIVRASRWRSALWAGPKTIGPVTSIDAPARVDCACTWRRGSAPWTSTWALAGPSIGDAGQSARRASGCTSAASSVASTASPSSDPFSVSAIPATVPFQTSCAPIAPPPGAGSARCASAVPSAFAPRGMLRVVSEKWSRRRPRRATVDEDATRATSASTSASMARPLRWDAVRSRRARCRRDRSSRVTPRPGGRARRGRAKGERALDGEGAVRVDVDVEVDRAGRTPR